MKRPHPENFNLAPDDVREYVESLERALIAMSHTTGFAHRRIPGVMDMQTQQYQCRCCGSGFPTAPIVRPESDKTLELLSEISYRRCESVLHIRKDGAPCS